jgi:hypothetical protein
MAYWYSFLREYLLPTSPLRDVTLAGLLVFSLLAGAHAMPPEEFLEAQRAVGASSNAKEVSINRAVMAGYMGGIAESFQVNYTLNNSVLYVNGRPGACPPNLNAMSVSGIEAAIRQEIGTFSNPKPLTAAAKKTEIVAVALVGLIKLYPCK